MRLFLIANNKNIQNIEKDLKDKIKEDDILVFMNRAIHFNKLKSYKNEKWIIINDSITSKFCRDIKKNPNIKKMINSPDFKKHIVVNDKNIDLTKNLGSLIKTHSYGHICSNYSKLRKRQI